MESELHANLWAVSEFRVILQNKSPTPSFDLYDWCFVTMFRHHNTSAFSLGLHPNVFRRSVAAVSGAGIGDGGGGVVGIPGSFSHHAKSNRRLSLKYAVCNSCCLVVVLAMLQNLG